MLAPYRVLDLTTEKGLFCGKILADLGAEVVKVEAPGGDRARTIGPFLGRIPHPERSLYWLAFNGGKKSITLDLATADGRDIFMQLAGLADFVIESYDPGYLAHLGLDYAVLARTNPRLVLTSITDFGQSGPGSGRRGSDLIDSALGGLVYICGDTDRPPVRITAEQAYLQGGIHAAGASLMAHYHRQKSGLGRHVDVSVQEAMAWTTMYTVPYWDTLRALFPRSGNLQTRFGSTYRLMFPCKDGYVSVRAYTGMTFGPWQRRLVQTMQAEGIGEELSGIDWPSLSFEGQPQEEIDRWENAMQTFFMRHTRQELHEMAREHEFGLYPSYTVENIMAYRQLEERGFWMDVDYPDLQVTLRQPGPAFRTEPALNLACRRSPLVGEHNEEIYAGELGLSKKDLIALRSSGVI